MIIGFGEWVGEGGMWGLIIGFGEWAGEGGNVGIDHWPWEVWGLVITSTPDTETYVTFGFFSVFAISLRCSFSSASTAAMPCVCY